MSRRHEGGGEDCSGLGPAPGGRKRGWQPGSPGPATSSQCTMQIKLELGHHAQLREKPTPEGSTYDWMVFVRGPEQSEIQHFVEKVVFRLNQFFPNPKRVCKNPPYQVEESSSEGFSIPIEIYLKNKGEPKRVCFTYDLSLNQKGNLPLDHVHYEELTFNNPTKEFRRKLIKAGGVISESDVSDPKKIKPSHESK